MRRYNIRPHKDQILNKRKRPRREAGRRVVFSYIPQTQNWINNLFPKLELVNRLISRSKFFNMEFVLYQMGSIDLRKYR